MTQLSIGSMSKIETFENEEKDDARSMELDVNDLEHIFSYKTCRQHHSTYDPSLIEFGGISGTIHFLNALLNIFQL